MKITIEIPDGYELDGYTVKPVPVPLFTFSLPPISPYIPPYIPLYIPHSEPLISGGTIDGMPNGEGT